MKNKCLNWIVVIIGILLLYAQPVIASSLEMDLILDQKTFQSSGEITGSISLINTQIKPINLFDTKVQLVSSSNEVVWKYGSNLSDSIPPFYSGSQPFFVLIPDVPEGDYVLKIEMNHSQGSSTTSKSIVLKSKRKLALSKIKEAETALKQLDGVNLSQPREEYLTKSVEYLTKANDTFSNGSYSAAYDYASISIQYSKIALSSDEITSENANYTHTLANETSQIYINSSEIADVLKRVEEIKTNDSVDIYKPVKPFSFSVLIVEILATMVVSLIAILIIRRRLSNKREK